jgi:hypothetical protein
LLLAGAVDYKVVEVLEDTAQHLVCLFLKEALTQLLLAGAVLVVAAMVTIQFFLPLHLLAVVEEEVLITHQPHKMVVLEAGVEAQMLLGMPVAQVIRPQHLQAKEIMAGVDLHNLPQALLVVAVV